MTETVTHEQKDVNVRRLLQFGAGLCAVIALSLIAMKLLFGFLDTHQPPGPAVSPLATGPEIPPKPRLEVYPHVDLEHKMQADEAVLNSYGWVDRESGVVRIPIDRALKLLAERGLPARGEKK